MGQRELSQRWRPWGKGPESCVSVAASPSSSLLWSALSLRCNKLLWSEWAQFSSAISQRYGDTEIRGCHSVSLSWLNKSLATGWVECVLQLLESDWMFVEWLDYFSELVALRTSAAHWTGLLDAAGCSCALFTSIMEGGDRQSWTRPLPLPSPISYFLSLFLSISHSFSLEKEWTFSPSLPPSSISFFYVLFFFLT